MFDESTYALWRIALHRAWNLGNSWAVCRTINELVSVGEELMGKPQNGSKQPAGTENFYFVNVRLQDDAWLMVAELYPTPDKVFDLLSELIANEHKVGFSLNGQSGLTTCSITDKRAGSPSFGACLTAAADGWYDALRVALYKFHTLLDGDLANGSRGSDERPRIM